MTLEREDNRKLKLRCKAYDSMEMTSFSTLKSFQNVTENSCISELSYIHAPL